VLVIFHALLAGSDLARPVVRSLFVGIATFTLVMATARVVFGRLGMGVDR